MTYFESVPYYRETFGCQLTAPLQPGVPIYVSYKVSPGGFGSWDGASAQFAAKGPGINFFTAYPADWSVYLYPNAAMVDMPGVLNDTSAWTTITGSFVPDSAYSYLVIGNFFADSLSQVEWMDTVFGSFPAAYSFVDQVCVSHDPAYCAGWNGIGEGILLPQVRVGPNPVADELVLSTPARGVHTWHIDVLDALGRHVERLTWPAGLSVLRASTYRYPLGVVSLVFSGEGLLPAPLRLVHVSP
jgi:hypothetical protein